MTWELRDHIEKCVPGISIDCVVFGYQNKKLHVLLLRYQNNEAWALPGGFLPKNQGMDTAATEVLKARTGLDQVFLRQFHTFSSLNRSWDCNELSSKGFEQVRGKWKEEDRATLERWFNQRFISTAYVALIDSGKVQPVPDEVSEACSWVPVERLPELVLDHSHIIQKALDFLRVQVNHLPIGRELLMEKFTMSDLQALYEAVLGKELDRGNFQRKMTKLNMLTRHEKLMTGAQNKAPYLYSINHKVYDDLIEKGIGFG